MKQINKNTEINYCINRVRKKVKDHTDCSCLGANEENGCRRPGEEKMPVMPPSSAFGKVSVKFTFIDNLN